MRNKKYISFLLVFTMLFSNVYGIKGSQKAKASNSNKKHVINIVWDGLSADLFNKLKTSDLNTPNIDILQENGTILNNVKTTIPSYGGAQAALVTGSYPEKNGFLYRYFDREQNKVISDTNIAYKLNGETIFESIKSQNTNIKTLGIGINVAGISLDGRGIYKDDENHKLIEYDMGDKLVSFDSVADDIIDAINSGTENMPDYILAYSNDIKMCYWDNNVSNEKVVSERIEELDKKLGLVIDSLKENNIYDDTIIILNSLSSMYSVPKRLNGDTIASKITADTGVSTEFTSGGVKEETKAVIIKTYIMKYGQLVFTNKATKEDKEKVLAYLNDKTNEVGKSIKEVIPSSKFNAPSAFAEYIINPIDETTFSAAAVGTGRMDTIDDLNQFCLVSGTGIIKGADVDDANIADIVPTISHILGINPPKDNEGQIWRIVDFVKPNMSIQLEGEKNEEGFYTGIVEAKVEASDDGQKVSIQYNTGDGYVDCPSGIFYVDRDCLLKVRAIDRAGNITEEEIEINFLKLVGDIYIDSDFDTIDGKKYTDLDSIILGGKIFTDNGNLKVEINNEIVQVNNNAFQKQISLANGENNISIEATLGDIGNNITETVYKVYDPVVTSIKDGQIVEESTIDIKGKVVPNSTVTINGYEGLVDKDGNFTSTIELDDGINEITVVSTVGKYINETKLNVSYYTSGEIEITNISDKQVVKTDSIIMKGKTDIPCKVTVNGKEAATNEDNSFSCEVDLDIGVNDIKVEADNNGVKFSKDIKIVRIDPNDNYVVYFNWDGFANYYYEYANQGDVSRTPVINQLIKEGVIFSNSYTGIPSITDAMQPAIVSGAWPETTGNAYRYYDKENNVVVQCNRFEEPYLGNKAETIAEAAVRQGLNVASIHQFSLENRGTTAGDPSKPYITSKNDSSYLGRFDEAIKLIKGDTIVSGAQLYEIPRFMAIYMDDLDGIGHNEVTTYGVPVAPTEEERLEQVAQRLEEMDAKLGEFIEACKDRGIYDNMSFAITTDHGMSPFGRQSKEPDKYEKSKLPELISLLQKLGYKNIEVLNKGQKAKDDTDIVIVCVGLQAQISFRNPYTEKDIENIINAVKNEEYFGEAMTKEDMKKRGVIDDFCDLIISPKAPYHFKVVTDPNKIYYCRGQHDSLDETAQHIFSFMWGKDIKEGYNYTDRMYNIDFARTFAYLLGIDGPKDATGDILTDALVQKSIPIPDPNPEPGESEKVRIAGSNRIETAVNISKFQWPNGSESVILASANNFPDALVGSALSYIKKGPILLTESNKIDDNTLSEIERLGAKNIYILGGYDAIGKNIEEILKDKYITERIGGKDRFETAAIVGKIVWENSNSDTAIITTSNDYADAISVAPFASKLGMPILFTDGHTINENTKEALEEWNIKNVIILGGTNSVSQDIEDLLYKDMGISAQRIWGMNRYETSVEIAKKFQKKYKYNGIVVSTGENFADGLSGTPLAYRRECPILLVKRDRIGKSTLDYIKDLNINNCYILGGKEAISENIEKEIFDCIK